MWSVSSKPLILDLIATLDMWSTYHTVCSVICEELESYKFSYCYERLLAIQALRKYKNVERVALTIEVLKNGLFVDKLGKVVLFEDFEEAERRRENLELWQWLTLLLVFGFIMVCVLISTL